MSINESIIEDAVLTWFGEIGYGIEGRPEMAPGEAVAEWKSIGEVILEGRMLEALTALMPSCAPTGYLATLRDKLLRGKLSVPEVEKEVLG